MNIVMLFAPQFPNLAEEFFSQDRKYPEIIETDYDISPLIYDDKAVVTDHNDWDFLFLNIEYCFKADFQKRLKRLSETKPIYMFAINNTAEGLWFEQYQDGKLTRQWISVEYQVEGNSGEYLKEEQILGYPFIDEAYEDVGEEMFYELIREITGFDVTTMIDEARPQ